MKTCTVCGEAKPFDQFYRRAALKSGRTSHCKDCHRERHGEQRRLYRLKNREAILEAKRRYYLENRDAYAKRAREQRMADPEGARERERQYRAANLEKFRAHGRDWHKRNPEPARERARKWARDHPEVYVARGRRRRLRAGDIGVEDLAYVEILRQDPCAYCGGTAGTVDHLEPLNSGGNGRWENLTASCRSCNSSKRTATLLAFLARA